MFINTGLNTVNKMHSSLCMFHLGLLQIHSLFLIVSGKLAAGLQRAEPWLCQRQMIYSEACSDKQELLRFHFFTLQ